MKIKKLLCVISSIAIVVMSFSACSKNNEQEIPSSYESSTSESTGATSQTTDDTTASSMDASSQTTTTKKSVNSNGSTTAKPTIKTTTKTTTTTKPTTKHTTKPTTKTTTKTTTKPTTKTTKTTSHTPITPYEVSTSSVKSISGATVKRAWRLSLNGVSAEIHRIAYGSMITQKFDKNNADSAIDINRTVKYQPICNIAIINCAPSKLNMQTAQKLLGKSSGLITDMAAKAGAIIAINGTASYSDGAPIIVNGVVASKGSGITKTRMMMYNNGEWALHDLNEGNAATYIQRGVKNSIRYQQKIMVNGQITASADNYYHNRTMIAQVSENKYIFAVGEFMPIMNMAKILQAYGAKNAVLLNGGNNSFMYVKGIGNVTGTKASKLKNLDKLSVIETEFFANNGMLGLNESGKQKLGGPSNDIDIVYVK